MFDHVCDWFQQRNVAVSERDCQQFKQLIHQVELPAHTVIMEQGKVVKNLFFLNSGIVRLFRIHNGKDITLDFISGHEFVSTAVYVLNQQPSPCGLETLTRIRALEIKRADLLTLKEQTSCSEQMQSVMLERLLNWNQEREMDVMTMTPEERYLKLMEIQPQVIRSVALKYIASYLSIHKDSLSRIRKKIAGKS